MMSLTWKRLEAIFARRLEDVLKTLLQDVLKMFLQDILKMFWGRLEDVWLRQKYRSWSRRLKDVFWRWRQKTFSRTPCPGARWLSSFAAGIKIKLTKFSGEIRDKTHREQLTFHWEAKQKFSEYLPTTINKTFKTNSSFHVK